MSEASLRKGKDGVVYLRVPKAGSKRREWVSTGMRTIPTAREMVERTGVDRLIQLHHARALTADAIALVTVGHRLTTEDIVKAWSEWVEIRVAPTTFATYQTHIRTFVEVLGLAKQPLSFATEKAIHDHVNDGKSSLNTATVRLAAIKSLFRFANAKGFIVGNAAELVEVDRRAMSVQQLEPKHFEPLSEDDYRKALGHFAGFWRDATVLGYCCGLRLIDVCLFEWDSFTATELIVYPSKSDKKRLALQLSDPLIVRPELRETIDRLLAGQREHEQFVWPEQAAFYITPQAHSYSDYYSRQMKKLGVMNCTFHSLRTAFARRLRAAGKKIEDVAKAMGHASTDTTAIYTGESAT